MALCRKVTAIYVMCKPCIPIRTAALLKEACLVAQLVKNPHAMQKTQVQSLGGEDPLEKGVATHSSVLAWKIPWTNKPGRLQSMESQRVGQDLATKAPP